MEIIIGREAGARRLLCVADGRTFAVGQAGSVPLSVSRQHCRLIVSGEKLTIENIKPENVTYVDGLQVLSKNITPTSRVQLSMERFTIPLQQIVSLATGRPAQPQQPQAPTFSLKPLKAVWEEYDKQRLAIQDDAARNANRQRLQGILSLTGMCIGFIPGIDQTLRVAIIVAALGVAIYFFIQGWNKDTVQKKLHDLDNQLAKDYKCPSCGRPFGAVPYRQIEFSKQCFSCGCKYTH